MRGSYGAAVWPSTARKNSSTDRLRMLPHACARGRAALRPAARQGKVRLYQCMRASWKQAPGRLRLRCVPDEVLKTALADAAALREQLGPRARLHGEHEHGGAPAQALEVRRRLRVLRRGRGRDRELAAAAKPEQRLRGDEERKRRARRRPGRRRQQHARCAWRNLGSGMAGPVCDAAACRSFCKACSPG